MKRQLLFSFFLFCVQYSIGQNYEFPKIQQYKFECHYWKDTLNSHQVLKFKNGNIKLEYIHIDGNRKLRKEYHENGRLKLTAEVIQEFVTDTFVSFNPETYEEDIEVLSGIEDIRDGQYIEYDFYRRIITKGSFKYGKKNGKWESTLHNLSYGTIFIEANYNDEGFLSGKYKEYYFDEPSKTKSIKAEGEVNVVLQKSVYRSSIKNKPHINYFQKSMQVGEWKYYNILGELEQIIIYQVMPVTKKY